MKKPPQIADGYSRLARTEDTHAEVWTKKLMEAGAALPMFRPAIRTRTLIGLARRYGVNIILPSPAYARVWDQSLEKKGGDYSAKRQYEVY